MIKIPIALIKDHNENIVSSKFQEGCEWVERDSIATIKWDGQACSIMYNQPKLRYDRRAKKSRKKYPKGYTYTLNDLKPAPDGWIPCNHFPDLITGSFPGWIPADRKNPQHKYFFQAYDKRTNWDNGTYELVGVKVNGNPYNMDDVCLKKHGADRVSTPKNGWTFDSILNWLQQNKDCEGLVFHHKDDIHSLNPRMAKIRQKDFFRITGFNWNNSIRNY